MLRFILAITFAATAAAQSATPTPPTQSSPLPRTITDWPTQNIIHPYDRLDISTLAQPTIRNSCVAQEITPDLIRCYPEHHHPGATYEREIIAAIIEPPDHSNLHSLFAGLAIAGVSLAASFFVPLGASITLRVLTGFFLDFGVFWRDGAGDHNDDRLLYQRPNTPLTLKLRHKHPSL